MKFVSFEKDKQQGLAVESNGKWMGLLDHDPHYPGDLDALVKAGTLSNAVDALVKGQSIDLSTVTYLPPLQRAPKIICVGLNYLDHTQESNMAQPDYPTLFTRFNSTLVAHIEERTMRGKRSMVE